MSQKGKPMKTTSLIVAVAFLASAMAVSVAADPPGNHSLTFEFLVFSSFDFKAGAGIYDSGDPANAFSVCILKLPGLSVILPIAATWKVDQNMGTNLNGPALGLSDLGIGAKPGGIDTLIPCPVAIGGGGGTIFITFDGMNWRSAEHDSWANLFLCTQKVFASSSPGCLALPSPMMKLWVSACGDQLYPLPDPVGNVADRTPAVPLGVGNQPDWATANFGGDYLDAKGKYILGEPWGALNTKSDVIKCPVRKTVDYTTTIMGFTSNQVSQASDLIKNEAVVHFGHGTTYMVICWEVEYLNFSDPLNPVPGLAQAHDWKLIIDLGDPDNFAPLTNMGVPVPGAGPMLPPGGPATNIFGGLLWDALGVHYGGARVGDNSVPLATTALRGFYSQDAGDPKDGGVPDGQNGFGPCGPPTQAWDSAAKLKKPVPLV